MEIDLIQIRLKNIERDLLSLEHEIEESVLPDEFERVREQVTAAISARLAIQRLQWALERL
jgi:hypothetical protein